MAIPLEVWEGVGEVIYRFEIVAGFTEPFRFTLFLNLLLPTMTNNSVKVHERRTFILLSTAPLSMSSRMDLEDSLPTAAQT